jgi:predicted ATPase
MKVAISGASGVGKTTLATALAESLGCTLLDENHSEIIARGAALRRARATGDKQAASSAVGMCRKVALAWLDARNESFKSLTSCVADRAAVDILLYWLELDLSQGNAREVGQMLERCRGYMNALDFFVFPPIPSRPLGTGGEQAAHRPKSVSQMILSQSALIGLAQQVGGVKILLLPRSASSTSDQVKRLQEQLQLT